MASTKTVFLRTSKNRFGPLFAEVEVDGDFTLRLVRLQRLCIGKRLSEVRVDTAPVKWGPRDVSADLNLFGDQLVVTQTSFRLTAHSKALRAGTQTRPQNIIVFLRAVRAHRASEGVLMPDEHWAPAKDKDWKNLPV